MLYSALSKTVLRSCWDNSGNKYLTLSVVAFSLFCGLLIFEIELGLNNLSFSSPPNFILLNLKKLGIVSFSELFRSIFFLYKKFFGINSNIGLLLFKLKISSFLIND